MNFLALNKNMGLQEWKNAIRDVANIKKNYPMLQDNLYTIIEKNIHTDSATYKIGFNAECEIYKVHFPTQPMTPGACLLEMAKEIAEDFTSTKLMLKIASNIRFLKPIDPNLFPVVNVDLKMNQNQEEDRPDETEVNLKIYFEEDVFAKMNLCFIENPVS